MSDMLKQTWGGNREIMHNPGSGGFAFTDILPPGCGCCSQCGLGSSHYCWAVAAVTSFSSPGPNFMFLLWIINRCKSKSIKFVVRKERDKSRSVYKSFVGARLHMLQFTGKSHHMYFSCEASSIFDITLFHRQRQWKCLENSWISLGYLGCEQKYLMS
jgi:hypothetical protein